MVKMTGINNSLSIRLAIINTSTHHPLHPEKRESGTSGKIENNMDVVLLLWQKNIFPFCFTMSVKRSIRMDQNQAAEHVSIIHHQNTPAHEIQMLSLFGGKIRRILSMSQTYHGTILILFIIFCTKEQLILHNKVYILLILGASGNQPKLHLGKITFVRFFAAASNWGIDNKIFLTLCNIFYTCCLK